MYSNEDVRRLNDLFRSEMLSDVRHLIVLSPGVEGSPDKSEIIEKVKNEGSFDPDDPEHRLGHFELSGQRYSWRIDYFDSEYDLLADPHQGSVSRVLTIMKADES